MLRVRMRAPNFCVRCGSRLVYEAGIPRCPACDADVSAPPRVEASQTEVTGARIGAALIDMVPMLALLFAMSALFGGVSSGGDAVPGSNSVQFNVSLGGRDFVHYLVLVVVYFTVSEAMTGTTPGKRAVGLVVIDSDGQRPKLLSLLLRNILRPLDFFPVFYLSGILTISFSPENKRLGDMVARTQVARGYKSLPATPPHPSEPDYGGLEPRSPQSGGDSVAPRMALAMVIVALISGLSIYLSSSG